MKIHSFVFEKIEGTTNLTNEEGNKEVRDLRFKLYFPIRSIRQIRGAFTLQHLNDTLDFSQLRPNIHFNNR